MSSLFSLISPTSNATRNLLTQLYAATVAVISTISLSSKIRLNRANISSFTFTPIVIASVYANCCRFRSQHCLLEVNRGVVRDVERGRSRRACCSRGMSYDSNDSPNQEVVAAKSANRHRFRSQYCLLGITCGVVRHVERANRFKKSVLLPRHILRRK